MDWTDVGNRPAGLDDGDDVGLTAVRWTDVQNRPAGLDDGDDTGSSSWETLEGRPSWTDGFGGTPNSILVFGSVDVWGNVVVGGRGSFSGPVQVSALDAGSGTIQTAGTISGGQVDGVYWSRVQNRPQGLDDGDDVGLTSVTWANVQNRPAGLDDGDDVGSGSWDTLTGRPEWTDAIGGNANVVQFDADVNIGGRVSVIGTTQLGQVSCLSLDAGSGTIRTAGTVAAGDVDAFNVTADVVTAGEYR